MGVGRGVRPQGKRHCIGVCRGVQLTGFLEGETIAKPIFRGPDILGQIALIATSYAFPVTALAQSVFIGARRYISHDAPHLCHQPEAAQLLRISRSSTLSSAKNAAWRQT